MRELWRRQWAHLTSWWAYPAVLGTFVPVVVVAFLLSHEAGYVLIRSYATLLTVLYIYDRFYRQRQIKTRSGRSGNKAARTR